MPRIEFFSLVSMWLACICKVLDLVLSEVGWGGTY